VRTIQDVILWQRRLRKQKPMRRSGVIEAQDNVLNSVPKLKAGAIELRQFCSIVVTGLFDLLNMSGGILAAILFRFAEPQESLIEILFDSRSKFIQDAKIALSVCMTLRGRLAIPLDGSGMIFANSSAI
jgi:hypothetical protein